MPSPLFLMFKLSTIIGIATAVLLKASLGSDSANSSEGTQRCDANIRDVRDKKDRQQSQHDLMSMIVYFTTTPFEDREMFLAICERASATEASAKEATEGLRRVFTYGDAPQQLSATRLWAHMLLYSPELFLSQCAKPDFLDALEDVLNSQSTSRVVRERLLDVLAGAVDASSRSSYQGVSGFGVLWRKVKSAEKPDEGVPFYHDDPITNLLSRRNTENTSNAMRLRRRSGEGDHTLSAVCTELASSVQRLVECCICMDGIPMGSIVHVDSCGHKFCRKCLHGHIAARTDELSFPIHCPACTAAKGKGKENASVISQSPDLSFGLADSYPPSMNPHSPHASAPSDMDSILYAMRLQREFDDEDCALLLQHTELVDFAERLFECSICMDDVPMDSIALIDSCGHTFCRGCLRGHVVACLEEHRFPVRCPTCTANKGNGEEQTGEVSQSLALELGLTDEQFNIWTEMEMVAFSILLHCRMCQRSMFVARDEHDDISVLACPLPDCEHMWCKHCQQTIDLNGPRHSCDGTSELDHLVKEQGWKYCPTCKTPIQKTSGCNHMTCITPACNTHFCYLCGELIVKSALSQEIEQATSSHYRRTCRLFEVPE